MISDGNTSPNHASRTGFAPKWPMSAYSASAPVRARNTAPRTRKLSPGDCQAKLSAYLGSSAASTAGVWTIEPTPSAASVRNHITIMGPNSLPSAPVPCAWMANKPTSTAIVIGMIQRSNAGVATDTPSTAESTEIAGVMIASP